MISKEELENTKKEIFDNNILVEEKEKIIEEINNEVIKKINEFESESDPIDE